MWNTSLNKMTIKEESGPLSFSFSTVADWGERCPMESDACTHSHELCRGSLPTTPPSHRSVPFFVHVTASTHSRRALLACVCVFPKNARHAPTLLPPCPKPQWEERGKRFLGLPRLLRPKQVHQRLTCPRCNTHTHTHWLRRSLTTMPPVHHLHRRYSPPPTPHLPPLDVARTQITEEEDTREGAGERADDGGHRHGSALRGKDKGKRRSVGGVLPLQWRAPALSVPRRTATRGRAGPAHATLPRTCPGGHAARSPAHGHVTQPPRRCRQYRGETGSVGGGEDVRSLKAPHHIRVRAHGHARPRASPPPRHHGRPNIQRRPTHKHRRTRTPRRRPEGAREGARRAADGTASISVQPTSHLPPSHPPCPARFITPSSCVWRRTAVVGQPQCHRGCRGGSRARYLPTR